MRKRRIFAWIGIAMLAGLYIADAILAIIGSESAQFMLKVSIVCTMVIPIILYGFSVLTGINNKKFKIPEQTEMPDSADQSAEEDRR